MNFTSSPQYEGINIGKIFFKLTPSNNYAQLQNDDIKEIKNFPTDIKNKDIIVIGHKFKDKYEFYTQPCNSLILRIYLVKNKTDSLNGWSINDIKSKIMMLPFKEDFVTIPIIHIVVDKNF